MSFIALEKFERAQLRSDIPQFRPGDTIRVNCHVREGDRDRIQAYEGICTKRNGGGHSEMVTVRKISGGIGVERTFFLHSPVIESIKLIRRGHVRRSRLYYLRERFGKKARVKGSKKIFTKIGLPIETVSEVVDNS
jgi:large subunit ribosomal protein L19